MNKRLLWFAVVVCMALVVAFFVFGLDKDDASTAPTDSTGLTGTTALEPARTISTATSTAAASSNATTARASTPGAIPEPGIAHVSLGVDGQLPTQLYGSGLTPEDRAWLDSQGFPALDTLKNRRLAYERFGIDQLMKLAEQGDVDAALAGESREFSSNETEVKSIMHELFNADFATKQARMLEWSKGAQAEQRRKFLWQAVIHGSSYAAERMASTYRTFVTQECFLPPKCDAWHLVSWRMGNWDTMLTSPRVVSEDGRTYVQPKLNPIPTANNIWARINIERANLGLPPLQLDLRPAYEKWIKMRKDKTGEYTVYPR